jgi:hypothetical protein
MLTAWVSPSLQDELEKVRKRQAEREAEKARREEELVRNKQWISRFSRHAEACCLCWHLHFCATTDVHRVPALQTLVQRMRAAQEAMESEAKEEEFYLQNLLVCAEPWLCPVHGFSKPRWQADTVQCTQQRCQ